MMSTTTSFLLAVFVLTTVVASTNPWKDCGSKLAKINAVRISGCDETMAECILHRNTNVTIEVDFTAGAGVDKINTVVHGIMMGTPIPFPLPQPDACKGAGLACPLAEGAACAYSTAMPILRAYPRVQLKVKWELQNAAKEDLVCLLIDAKIQ